MTLGEKIKYLRKQKKITQEELAKTIGAVRGTLANWEIDVASPDKEMLIKIADFFKVTTDYLLGREEKSIDYSPLEKFIKDFQKLPDKERKEAVKRLINLALEEDPSNKKGN